MDQRSAQAKKPLHSKNSQFLLPLTIIAATAFTLLTGCSSTQTPTATAGLKDSRSPIQQVSFLSDQDILAPIVTLGPNDHLDTLLKQTSGNVLIDFYADWCAPCRKQAKILHDLENTIVDSHTTVVKVNVDHHPSLSKRFNIKGLPTIVVLEDGQYVNRMVGFSDRSRIENVLKK